MSKNERLKELRRKRKLTNEEWKELIQLSPSGSIKKSPFTMQNIGIKDLKTAFNNLKGLAKRIKNARKNKCYLEVFSLRLLMLDFYLRIYLCGISIMKVRLRVTLRSDIMFGELIKAAEIAGMHKKHIRNLRRFNNDRTKAIHRLLLGEIKNKDLSAICDKYDNLTREIRDCVFAQPFFTPLTKPTQSKGAV